MEMGAILKIVWLQLQRPKKLYMRTNRSFIVLLCSLTTTKERYWESILYVGINVPLPKPLPPLPLKMWMNASHRVKYSAYDTILLVDVQNESTIERKEELLNIDYVRWRAEYSIPFHSIRFGSWSNLFFLSPWLIVILQSSNDNFFVCELNIYQVDIKSTRGFSILWSIKQRRGKTRMERRKKLENVK